MKKILILNLLLLLVLSCSPNKTNEFLNKNNYKKIDLIQNAEFEKKIYWDLELATVFFNYEDITDFIQNKIETLELKYETSEKLNDFQKCLEHLEALFLLSNRVDYFFLDVELLAPKIFNLFESGNVKILDKGTNRFQKELLFFDEKEEFEMPNIPNRDNIFLQTHRLVISHTYRYYCLSDGKIFFSTRDYFRFPYLYDPKIYPEVYDYPDIFEINAKFNKISKQ
ncbi:MAG TPA: hypothetical protein ENL20_10135 [Candidatus Cloacimonetes bacterium]|nr:hypothetical protein [Candidatus Cloacimonadota bacterium]